jgi:hypothetical protein
MKLGAGLKWEFNIGGQIKFRGSFSQKVAEEVLQ